MSSVVNLASYLLETVSPSSGAPAEGRLHPQVVYRGTGSGTHVSRLASASASARRLGISLKTRIIT